MDQFLERIVFWTLNRWPAVCWDGSRKVFRERDSLVQQVEELKPGRWLMMAFFSKKILANGLDNTRKILKLVLYSQCFPWRYWPVATSSGKASNNNWMAFAWRCGGKCMLKASSWRWEKVWKAELSLVEGHGQKKNVYLSFVWTYLRFLM